MSLYNVSVIDTLITRHETRDMKQNMAKSSKTNTFNNTRLSTRLVHRKLNWTETFPHRLYIVYTHWCTICVNYGARLCTTSTYISPVYSLYDFTYTNAPIHHYIDTIATQWATAYHIYIKLVYITYLHTNTRECTRYVCTYNKIHKYTSTSSYTASPLRHYIEYAQ